MITLAHLLYFLRIVLSLGVALVCISEGLIYTVATFKSFFFILIIKIWGPLYRNKFGKTLVVSNMDFQKLVLGNMSSSLLISFDIHAPHTLFFSNLESPNSGEGLPLAFIEPFSYKMMPDFFYF